MTDAGDDPDRGERVGQDRAEAGGPDRAEAGGPDRAEAGGPDRANRAETDRADPTGRRLEDTDRGARERVRIRRAPRLGVFVLLGVVVGVIAALTATSLFEADPKIGFAATAGYFSIYGVVFGALLGALVGLVLDAASRRRAREAEVERERVDPERVERQRVDQERADRERVAPAPEPRSEEDAE